MALSSRRAGYAYLWVLMIVALVAALTAIAAMGLSQLNDTSDVKATASTLADVAAGVDSFNLLVKRGSSAFTTPARLSLLDTTVVNGSQAGCSTQTYNATAVTNWATHAPYLGYYFPTGGLWTPLGRIEDAPSRTAATKGTQRTSTSDPYYIQIDSVSVDLARMLDIYVDGTLGSAAGTVQYTTTRSDSTVLLSYLVTLVHAPAC